jgi:hypothetical protein
MLVRGRRLFRAISVSLSGLSRHWSDPHTYAPLKLQYSMEPFRTTDVYKVNGASETPGTVGKCRGNGRSQY